MAISKTKHHSRSNDKAKRRTPRACDRCRLKKSKCDGTTLCKTCQASDSTCTYTARRGREARSYYCQMREVTDEALQRLYWACRSRSGFPGDTPDESNGPPSTAAILDALGLMRPSLEELGCPENLHKHANPSGSPSSHPQQRVMSPPSAASLTQDEYLPSPTQSSFSMSSMAHSPKSGPSLATPKNTSIIPATPPELGMSEQFLYAASGHVSSRSNSTTNSADYSSMENSSSVTFDMDTYLDTSSCTIPLNAAHPILNIHTSTQYDIAALMETSRAIHPVGTTSLQQDPESDSYLSPWPGSLAAAYHTVATAH